MTDLIRLHCDYFDGPCCNSCDWEEGYGYQLLEREDPHGRAYALVCCAKDKEPIGGWDAAIELKKAKDNV